MNSVVFDILTDTQLRDQQNLEASVAEHISAGIPWLAGEE